ncbi:hypothetical protein JOQ06_012846 [Pogonophryne albipinna]|uniref:Uncharacterized protein n=1 Tax=Pogonophryne albipinna TaxID=1090488 RepID=A0AAD6FQK0_9TELE|nr:hypothetical protein JOQ06_012846 [Pogonophryne albipinna]
MKSNKVVFMDSLKELLNFYFKEGRTQQDYPQPPSPSHIRRSLAGSEALEPQERDQVVPPLLSGADLTTDVFITI